MDQLFPLFWLSLGMSRNDQCKFQVEIDPIEQVRLFLPVGQIHRIRKSVTSNVISTVYTDNNFFLDNDDVVRYLKSIKNTQKRVRLVCSPSEKCCNLFTLK